MNRLKKGTMWHIDRLVDGQHPPNKQLYGVSTATEDVFYTRSVQWSYKRKLAAVWVSLVSLKSWERELACTVMLCKVWNVARLLEFEQLLPYLYYMYCIQG
jgi:hypothetical protein